MGTVLLNGGQGAAPSQGPCDGQKGLQEEESHLREPSLCQENYMLSSFLFLKRKIFIISEFGSEMEA